MQIEKVSLAFSDFSFRSAAIAVAHTKPLTAE